MKKLIVLLLIITFIVFSLGGCKDSVEIERKAVDVRYSAACDKVETDYVYKYNWIEGEYILLPDTKTVHYDEKYEIRYNITYDDGSTSSEWQTVDKETYEKERDKLPP